MKTAIFTIALILSYSVLNSQNLNEYKYVVVPESFGFLDAPNEYKLNALTKFLFENTNLNALMKSEQKPSDLKANGCLALYADVEENSNLFVTKLTVVLENCNGEVVFRSKEGRSRKKDFKSAHHEALRNAFTSFEALEYQYEEKPVNAATDEVNEPIAKNKQEVSARIPEENVKAAMAEEQEDEEREIAGAETGEEYILDNSVYFLEESNSGYSFYQKGMAEPFASLMKAEGQESFIYASVTKQGLAYFDDEGHLIVEHFNRNKNQMIKTIYKVQN